MISTGSLVRVSPRGKVYRASVGTKSGWFYLEATTKHPDGAVRTIGWRRAVDLIEVTP